LLFGFGMVTALLVGFGTGSANRQVLEDFSAAARGERSLQWFVQRP
jgi:hypothetical protein